MKTHILTLFICLLSLSVVSQNKDRDILKAQKISFITNKLDLTETEAQAFWPIYNHYDKITSKIKYQDLRKIRHEIKENINSLTDEKATEILKKLNKAENDLHKQSVELSLKLSKIISSKKMILLKVAEEDFKRKILERYKNKRRQEKNK